MSRGLVLALLAGCASTPPSSLVPDDLLVAMQVADELERDRQFALARDQLAAAVEHADTPERADSLRLRVCELWARQGNVESALECYRTADLGDDESRALAAYRIAVIELELGDRDRARAGMIGVIEEFPGTDAARRSLRNAAALAREVGGTLFELELLLNMAQTVRDRVQEPGVLDLRLEATVRAARLALEEVDDPEGAASLAAQAVAEGSGSAWLDDAIVWQARALVRLEQSERALVLYQRIIDDRESSWFVGSYDSVFLDDALFERAEVLEAMGRTDEARRAFEELLDEVPDSRLVDDAAFRAARLSGVGALEGFVRDYPDSRHVREARELLEAP